MNTLEKKSARSFGLIFFVLGILLGLISSKPESEQPQQVANIYNFPPVVISTFSPGIAEIPTQPSPAPTDVMEIDLATVETPINSPPVPTQVIPSTAFLPPPPTNTLLPPVTNTAVPTIDVPVWAIDEIGVRVNIPTSGMYKVEYLGDAYTPWPSPSSEGYRGWTNIVRIYHNRDVEWGMTDYGLQGPINQDAYLGPGNYYLNRDDAIAVAKGDSRTFRLNAGDFLILITLDEKGRYFDNNGKADVRITYLGQ